MSSVDIKNDKREDVRRELEESVKRALTAVGMQAVADIVSKGDFPVDTGLLRNSITFAVSGEAPQIGSYRANKGGATGSYSGSAPNDKNKAVYIGTNVHYAKYVEFGTSKMVARDFMNAPLKANFGHYKDLMTQYLKTP